ncbi:chemotaxis protein CheA [Chitinispirillales bacterium ANBcel5]|uniref:chemotaxis protein CheA n=1 Tax=Cellulosispirillum alkaliphilum TaxID=3039283 RepID=UPI002A573A23|nr:chemotaxis protein CheA [Chitinispirillales bacterium ANBcel5]
MNHQEHEVLDELILESRDHLSSIEPDLLSLEESNSTEDSEVINRIFRAIHSIKGGFSFFGYEKIIKLSHVMENVLSRVRNGEIVFESEIIDGLLCGVDKLRLLLDDIEGTEHISIAEEVQILSPFLKEKTAEVKGKKKNTTVRLSVSAEQKHRIIKEGKFLYKIEIVPKRDFIENKMSPDQLFEKWEKIGEIVKIKPDPNGLTDSELKKVQKITALYSTVLEPDLVSVGTGIAQTQIENIDLARNKEKKRVKQEVTMQKNETLENKDSVTKHKIEDSLRVRIGLLNNLMNLAGELVLGRNQLIQNFNRSFFETENAQRAKKKIVEDIVAVAENNGKRCNDTDIDRIAKQIDEAFSFRLIDIKGVNGIVQNIDMTTSTLQENIMQTRMQPISVVFSKFPRVVRDLAKKLAKEVELAIIGQEVELDKSIIELLSDPLTHLIRNCVDHGIEAPQVRQKAGKSAKGKIVLRSFHEGGKVNIEITDDGAGINSEAVKKKAIEKSIITNEQAESMSEQEIQMLIFSAGFSTAKKVNDISGRGVGMDVVKTNIERLGGTIELQSQKGQGLTIYLRLPLTLAIIPSLIVTANTRHFAIPQMGIEEVVRIRAGDITKKIESVQGSEVFRLRDKLLPLVRLTDLIGLENTYRDPKTGELRIDRRRRWSDRRGLADTKTDEKLPAEQERRKLGADRRVSVSNAIKIVVLKNENRHFGLVVDDVRDNEEIVVKPLSEYLKECKCYSGATIMGDGRVAMILDPGGIAEAAKLRFDKTESAQRERNLNETTKNNLEEMLIFNIGSKELFALKLNSVARIEKRKVEDIENVGDNEYIQFEKKLLHLIRVDNYLPVTKAEEDSAYVFVIVPNNTEKLFGIVAKKVEDVVKVNLVLDRETIKGTGVKGTAIINNKMVVVVDIKSLSKLAEDRSTEAEEL